MFIFAVVVIKHAAFKSLLFHWVGTSNSETSVSIERVALEGIIVEVILRAHDIILHVAAMIRFLIIVVFIITPAVISTETAKENILDDGTRIGKQAAVLLAITALVILILHFNVTSSAACLLLLFLCFFLQLFRLVFPLLFKAVWEFIVNRDLHIGLLLNQNDAVVEVIFL